jgi:hypothetical protein
MPQFTRGISFIVKLNVLHIFVKELKEVLVVKKKFFALVLIFLSGCIASFGISENQASLDTPAINIFFSLIVLAIFYLLFRIYPTNFKRLLLGYFFLNILMNLPLNWLNLNHLIKKDEIYFFDSSNQPLVKRNSEVWLEERGLGFDDLYWNLQIFLGIVLVLFLINYLSPKLYKLNKIEFVIILFFLYKITTNYKGIRTPLTFFSILYAPNFENSTQVPTWPANSTAWFFPDSSGGFGLDYLAGLSVTRLFQGTSSTYIDITNNFYNPYFNRPVTWYLYSKLEILFHPQITWYVINIVIWILSLFMFRYVIFNLFSEKFKYLVNIAVLGFPGFAITFGYPAQYFSVYFTSILMLFSVLYSFRNPGKHQSVLSIILISLGFLLYDPYINIIITYFFMKYLSIDRKKRFLIISLSFALYLLWRFFTQIILKIDVDLYTDTVVKEYIKYLYERLVNGDLQTLYTIFVSGIGHYVKAIFLSLYVIGLLPILFGAQYIRSNYAALWLNTHSLAFIPYFLAANGGHGFARIAGILWPVTLILVFEILSNARKNIIKFIVVSVLLILLLINLSDLLFNLTFLSYGFLFNEQPNWKP